MSGLARVCADRCSCLFCALLTASGGGGDAEQVDALHAHGNEPICVASSLVEFEVAMLFLGPCESSTCSVLLVPVRKDGAQSVTSLLVCSVSSLVFHWSFMCKQCERGCHVVRRLHGLGGSHQTAGQVVCNAVLWIGEQGERTAN